MIQTKVKPIIGRVGGKVRLAPWVVQHLTRFQWSLYCEPFAGSAAVYFRMIQDGIFEQIRARKHHPRVILNDADSRIVPLYPEADWEHHYKDTVASSAVITRNSKTRSKSKRRELLLVRKRRAESPVQVDFTGQLSIFSLFE